MSSSEQAPEPTMDEILASIRKIISDDEPGGTAQPEGTASETATPEAAAPADGAPENDGLSDDLANALNDGQGSPVATDDIFDLTQVVEQQTPVEAEAAPAPQADLPPVPPLGDALQDALKGMGDENVSSPDAASPSSEPAGEQNISALLAETGVQDTPGQAQATPDALMEAPSREELGAVLGQAVDAVAPAVDSSMSESKVEAMTEPPPSATGTPEQAVEPPPSIELPDMPLADVAADEEAADTMADVAAAETVKDEPADASMAEGAPQSDELAQKLPDLPPDLSPEMPATEPEISVEAEMPAIDVPEADIAAAAIATDAPSESATSDEQDTPDASASAEQGVTSLEDSVKDMLRPLLREWLDDNMERIVQDTVKDEVASGNLKPDNN